MKKILLKFVFLLREKFYDKEIDSDLNFNQYMDLGTGVLSGILQRLLEKNNWDKGNWIDDVLIRNIETISNQIFIYGNAIYGKPGTTKEFISPFLFQILLDADWTDFITYECCFDTNKDELDYLVYNKSRDEWNEYFNQNFSSLNDKWRYVIESKNKE